MKLTIYKTDGTSSGKEAELSDSIFSIDPNETVLYEDVRRILANRRQGTAKTKERGEVRGGGRKAYKQKGTGMARRGSMRSPLLKGGGTVFGPSPRNYTVNLTKKAKRLARKSALTLKAREEAIKVVEDFSMDAPKTKDFIAILAALEMDTKKVLVLLGETDRNTYLSSRNIPNVTVARSHEANTYDILNAEYLLFTDSAVSALQESIEGKIEEEAA
jgi:large subunit ribosomal protein L4